MRQPWITVGEATTDHGCKVLMTVNMLEALRQGALSDRQHEWPANIQEMLMSLHSYLGYAYFFRKRSKFLKLRAKATKLVIIDWLISCRDMMHCSWEKPRHCLMYRNKSSHPCLFLVSHPVTDSWISSQSLLHTSYNWRMTMSSLIHISDIHFRYTTQIHNSNT